MSGLECPTVNPGSSSLYLHAVKKAQGSSPHGRAPLSCSVGHGISPRPSVCPWISYPRSSALLEVCIERTPTHTPALPCDMPRRLCTRTDSVITAKSVRHKQAQKGPRSLPSTLLPTAGLTASAGDDKRRPRHCSLAFKGVRVDVEVYYGVKQVRERKASTV